MRVRYRSLSIAALTVAASLVPGALAAQDATPSASQRIPQPTECRVKARSSDELLGLLGLTGGTPTAAAPASTPEPFSIPLGEPADTMTENAVTDTARELIACLNAGDIPRASALLTDEAVDPLLVSGPVDAAAADKLKKALTAEPKPLDEKVQTRVLAITDVSLLKDGRAAAFIVVNDPLNPPSGPETLLMTFSQQGRRWLIDGVVHFSVPAAAPAGTPTP